MDQEQEFEVIRAVVAGSRNEFRHLVREHQSYVYTLMLKQVGNKALAEELAQETFIRAFKGLAKFRFDSRFATWITRIALNQSKSYFRSRRFKESSVQDTYTEKEHQFSNEKTAETDLIQSESLKKLQEAIAKLSPNFRDVLLLCALEKKSYEEASQILDVPVGTVRSRLNRARHQLKDIYFEEA